MSVALNRFRTLNPEGQQLIQRWFERGWISRDCDDADSFEPFIYTYIAFNGWAACVTRQDQDWKIIRDLKEHEPLSMAFHRWIQEDASLHSHSEAFRSLWPIFSAKGLRTRRIPTFRGPDRAAVVAHYRAHGATDCKPEEGDLSLTWPNMLEALYQVRCNLFHGEKCISSEGDQRIVGAAFRFLVHWFRKCIDSPERI